VLSSDNKQTINTTKHTFMFVFAHIAAACAAQSAFADPVLHGPRALRICRPPPPYNASMRTTVKKERVKKACLVIGDSVSLGYTNDAFGKPGSGGQLAENMTGICDVLHAPFSGDGGACDSGYGLQCGALWLASSLNGDAAPEYAAITFNFGLHDTNDSGFDEEARDEHVPLAEYGSNLLAFVKLVRQYQPKAQLAWLSSTPMHFNMHLNSNVLQYNAIAEKLLVDGGVVDATTDMYAVVVAHCGQPPYYGSVSAPNCTNHCPLIEDNEEYHYNSVGWHILAATVRTQFLALLAKGPRVVAPTDTSSGADAAAATENVAVDRLDYAKAGTTTCPDGVTACPAGTTCVGDSNANTKWGCCMVPDATSCNDGFHCCGVGTVCKANGTNPISKKKPTPLGYSHVCMKV